MPLSRGGAIRAGRAFVEAFLDTTQLEKQLASIRTRLSRFSQQVAAIGGTLVGAGVALLAPMIAAVKLYADAGDQLDKMSKRTGFAVETLSALDFAASQSGASIEQLDRALAAMARFTLQASRGLATATDVLDEIGLTVDDVASGSPEQKFMTLAQAISEVEDPTLKVGIALQVFGRQGRELLPMLEGGEAGMDALMDRARELGIVMTGEDARAAAEMTDSLDELFRSVKFLAVTVARELMPEALDFSRFLTETIPEIREWLGENKEMIVLVAKLGALLLAAGGGMLLLATAIRSVNTVLGVADAGLKLLSEKRLPALGKAAVTAFAVVAIIAFAREVYNANSAVRELNASLEKNRELNNELLGRQGNQQQDVLQKAGTLSGKDRDAFLNRELEAAEKNLAGMQASLKGQQQLIDDLAPTWKSLWQAGRANWKVEREQLEAQNERLKQQKKFVQELRELRANQQRELDENNGRTAEEVQGIEQILGRLNEELETFGLDAGQKAVRELEKLNANEQELAQAREKLAALTEKEAEAERQKQLEEARKREEEEAQRAAESIAQILEDLANEVSDLSLDPEDRPEARLERELRGLGADEATINKALALQSQIDELSKLGTSDDPRMQAFSGQGGTFSAMASRIFFNGDTPLKKIEKSSEETARNTRTIAKHSGPVRFVN